VSLVTLEARRALVRLLLGLALVVLLALGALGLWVRATPPELGVVDDPPPNVPLATDKSLGVNADLSRYDATAREEALAAIEAAGFRWLRQRFPWDKIEPRKGVYDWAVWDDIVEGALQHNLALVAVLDGSPAWARGVGDGANPLAPPVEAADYGAFAVAFAERYGDRIDHYQIWDEPNIAPHWGAGEIDPAAYARLLREGAIQIRAADPEAVILTAALAPNVEPGGANMSDLLFLDALYEQKAAEWFDVVAAQPYAFDHPPGAPPDPEDLNWRRIELLRDVIESHGDGQTAVWAASFGLGDMAPETLSKATEKAREDWPWLGPALWAAWSPGDAHGQYALTDVDGRPGTIYGVLRTLATAPVVAWPGVYPAHHPSGHYEGDWRVTPSGADIGRNGDRLTIPFRGTRLDLTLRRGDYRAFLFVGVDGQAANALPQDSEGRAYVVLYDPLQKVDAVTVARDLTDGDHEAEIVADRGWGQWAIVGWTVSREPTQGLGWRWLSLVLGLAALVILGAVIRRSWSDRYLLRSACNSLVAGYRAADDRLALAITAAAAVVVYVSAGTLPSLVAVGLLAVLLLLRPGMGLPLIALVLPFYQLGKPLLGKVFSMVEILTLLTALGWVVNKVVGNWGFNSLGFGPGQQVSDSANRQSRDRFHVSRLTALDWAVIALVTVGVASLLWSEHGRVAAREFRTVILESALFYGLLRVMVRDRRNAWRVADTWVLGGAMIALVGLFQWAFGQNLITVDGVWRVRGFYGSPNNLALYLGRVLPLGVAVAAWGQRGTRKWAYGLAAVVMAAAILFTYSRGAWLLGVPASLLFLAAMRGRRVFAVAFGALLVIVVVLMLIVGPGRLTPLLDTAAGTTFFRLQLWQSSWAMIRDHPLLGVGLDNFLYYYRTYYVLPTAWEEFNLSHPHNLVLDFWLRLGLPGLVVLTWLLVGFFRQGWQTYHNASPPGVGDRLLVLGLMGGMVSLVAHGLVDNALFLVDLAFAFMLMLALVQWANRGRPETDD
jgi:O-antigen ligase